jgi:hypothetical protein
MNRRRYFLALIAAFAGTSLWAAAQSPRELMEENRARLVELRKSPEQLARLNENLKAFLDLPEGRQAAITKLERELSEFPAKKRDRLLSSLERYVDWLEQLRKKDPATYRAIKEAPTAAARLALIKDRRDREWMEQQPKKYRDEWEKLTGAARAEFVVTRRAAERHKHEQWLIARRFWKELESGKTMPSRLADFADGKTEKVKRYVEEYLLPNITADEKKQLERAEGHWPDYPQTLVAVARKYPSALPPKPPRKFADLPVPVQHRLTDKKKGDLINKKLQNEIKGWEGPLFASKIVSYSLRDGKQPFAFEYLAANDKALSPPMKDFVEHKLIPALKDQAEKRKLTDSLGKWPEYPETIQELAKKHSLSPPWHILPDEKIWKWDNYRNSRCRSWGSEIAKEKK